MEGCKTKNCLIKCASLYVLPIIINHTSNFIIILFILNLIIIFERLNLVTLEGKNKKEKRTECNW
jgi:hypothetical protein